MPKNQKIQITNFDAFEEQVEYWRTHLDLFLEQCFPPMRLTPAQHLIARAVGNGQDVKVVCSRGFGKTYVIAWCAFGLGVLYPGSNILVVSATAIQATLVLDKLRLIAEQNENVAREIKASNSKKLISINGEQSSCELKNGSKIFSKSLASARGTRAKLIIVDECLDIDQELLSSIVFPIRNAKRDITINYGFKDFQSKLVCLTSACEKGNPFYEKFMITLREMGKGDNGNYCMTFDYNAAIENGITDAEFFEGEKLRMPASVFDMEYGTKFIGSSSNSAFPYSLIEPCRTLQKIELAQPKSSKSNYVISIDIATSEDEKADNSIISVIKYTERSNGEFAKKLVYMRSFHGKSLDVLAEEIRKLYHTKFPNATAIVYDARGLGDSFDRFFDKEWIDLTTGKEYPPLVTDEEYSANSSAIKILHPFRAVQQLNQRLYSNMRVCLEQRSIEFPAPSRVIQSLQKEGAIEKIAPLEMNVFYEADALQLEMGNIVAKIGSSGNVLYDTPRATLHKDRYSSVAMGLDYICEIEKNNIRKNRNGNVFVGMATKF